MADRSDIIKVRESMQNHIGEKVLLRGTLGRNKMFEREGTLIDTYPNIFVIKMDDDQRNVTYSYTDLFMKSVEVVGDNICGMKLFENKV